MGEQSGRSWSSYPYTYPPGTRRATDKDVSREHQKLLQERGIPLQNSDRYMSWSEAAELQEQAQNRAHAARGAQYGITRLQNNHYRDPNATVPLINADRPASDFVDPSIKAGDYAVNGVAVDRPPAQPFKPTAEPLRPAFEQGASALGSALNAASSAGRGAMDGAYIRMAKMMQDRADVEADLEALRNDPPKPEPEPEGTYRQPQSVARGNFERNDYLRRMANRYEQQLGQSGRGYEDLEAEYNSVPGSHRDKVMSMAGGIINRLRAAREMDSSKRLREHREVQSMASRLGVHPAGVIFTRDMANARTPEDRIRTVLGYHAMFPNLGLGNMAAMMSQQAAEGQGMEMAGRQAEAARTQQASEAALDRESQERLAAMNSQAQMTGQGLTHQNDYNMMLAQQGAQFALQTSSQQHATELQEMMGRQDLARFYAAQAAAAEQQNAQSPTAVAARSYANVLAAPLAQRVQLALQHYRATLRPDDPAVPGEMTQAVVGMLQPSASQVAREVAMQRGRATTDQLAHLTQYLELWEQTNPITNGLTTQPGAAKLGQWLNLQPEELRYVLMAVRQQAPSVPQRPFAQAYMPDGFMHAGGG